MSLFGRNKDIYVSYDPDKVNPADLDDLREEMANTFREKPETYAGKEKLGIITTAKIALISLKKKLEKQIADLEEKKRKKEREKSGD